MQLIERVWAVVTCVLSIVSRPQIQYDVYGQLPLSGLLPSITASSLPAASHMEPNRGGSGPSYPYFPAPGAPAHDEDKFVCEYPTMTDWIDCSTEKDRKCWLRHKTDGRQYDIYTDYENDAPVGKTRYYWIDVADGVYDADGLDFPDAKLFNKKYPGPWIQACWGDTVVVNVTNSLSQNGTSIHWHGIRQLNSVHMDGVNGVTQCPIAPGDFFVYNFTLKQYGSSWYHSHYSVQYADGAAGPMTIYGPSSADWDEAKKPLIMTDWYHKSAFYILTNRSAEDSKEVAKDILLNGRGNVNKFFKDINQTEIKPALNITFQPPKIGRENKKYLLRVINTSFSTTFVFSIDNHMIQVVSADFVPIVPYRNTSILVGIGQRYNVIVEANPINTTESRIHLDTTNYWIRTQISHCFGGGDQPRGYDETGILRYNESNRDDPTTKQWSNISTACSDETYTSLSPVLPWFVGPPSNGYGENFQVHFARQHDPEDYPVARFTMDDVGFAAPMRINYSNPTFLNLNPEGQAPPWSELLRVVQEDFTDNNWIYLAIRGSKSPDNATAGAHPIHLHGHDFAILEQAENKRWNYSAQNLRLINPPRRDVVLLPQNGYVVIAFKADNPGPWLVHCHIAIHISKGLGMQIMENQRGAFKIWPDKHKAINETYRVCGNWNNWYHNQSHWANPPPPKGKCKYNEKPEWCFQDDSGV